jgi:hypothetical protein
LSVLRLIASDYHFGISIFSIVIPEENKWLLVNVKIQRVSNWEQKKFNQKYFFCNIPFI